TALERRDEPLGEMPRRVLEAIDHVADDIRPGEDVALGGRVLAALVSGPRGRLRSGERGVLAFEIHHRELPALLRPVIRKRIGISAPDLFDDRLRLQPLPQEIERLRAIADVDDRLRRGDANRGIGPQHAVASREHARLYGAADFAGCRIEPENRERSRIPERLPPLKPSSSTISHPQSHRDRAQTHVLHHPPPPWIPAASTLPFWMSATT